MLTSFSHKNSGCSVTRRPYPVVEADTELSCSSILVGIPRDILRRLAVDVPAPGRQARMITPRAVAIILMPGIAR